MSKEIIIFLDIALTHGTLTLTEHDYDIFRNLLYRPNSNKNCWTIKQFPSMLFCVRTDGRYSADLLSLAQLMSVYDIWGARWICLVALKNSAEFCAIKFKLAIGASISVSNL